jgi:hypothetical protein
MSADEVTPVVPAAAAQEQRAQWRKGGVGRGLARSNEERTALVVQVYELFYSVSQTRAPNAAR